MCILYIMYMTADTFLYQCSQQRPSYYQQQVFHLHVQVNLVSRIVSMTIKFIFHYSYHQNIVPSFHCVFFLQLNGSQITFIKTVTNIEQLNDPSSSNCYRFIYKLIYAIKICQVFYETFVRFTTFKVYMFKHSNLLCWKEESLRQPVM